MRWVYGGFVVILGLGYLAMRAFDTDEDAIRRELAELASAATVGSVDRGHATLTRAALTSSFFTDDTVVELRSPF